ncbi:MAG: metal-dependent hydrolase [Cyanobacteria bacterium P01_D01_bin.73]
MSSFIGHGLAAVTISEAIAPNRRPFLSRWRSLIWLGWLIIIAWAPDIDYAVPALTMAQNEGARITHAIASSLLLPSITVAGLFFTGFRGQKFYICAWQAILSGLSHPVMDWFVGVIALPLFWPLNSALIKAPVGLLPSAGKPHWQNYYFYNNLLIELGILVPLMIIFLRSLAWQKHKLSLWKAATLIAISTYFLSVSINLSR